MKQRYCRAVTACVNTHLRAFLTDFLFAGASINLAGNVGKIKNGAGRIAGAFYVIKMIPVKDEKSSCLIDNKDNLTEISVFLFDSNDIKLTDSVVTQKNIQVCRTLMLSTKITVSPTRKTVLPIVKTTILTKTSAKSA